MGGPNRQGKFRGTNKLCQQCIKECKQFENVKIMKCFFVSNQKKGDTLQAQESSGNATLEGVLGVEMEKPYVGMGLENIDPSSTRK